MNKKDLGQFFTTNVDHILQGFEVNVNNKSILDPFAGGGDLLKWAQKNGASSVVGLDIDPNLINDHISLNDSLVNIPKSDFVLTNPPYLAKNKMTVEQKTKYIMDTYEDFYLLAINRIIASETQEGIIIIPVNFFSAENSDNLRKEFLNKYIISKVNYFKNQVFEDTTYNVVAFHYYKKTEDSFNSQKLEITIYPDKIIKSFDVEEQFSYRIAGRDLHKLISIKPMKTIRLTEDIVNKNIGDQEIKAFFNDKKDQWIYNVTPEFKKIIKNNIILLNCIDTNGSEEGWIKAEDVRTLGQDCLVGKNSSRNIAYVILSDCPVEYQEKIIPLFNSILNHLRKKHNSLFFTNFRDNDRKRVSFDFCYKLISYCYKMAITMTDNTYSTLLTAFMDS